MENAPSSGAFFLMRLEFPKRSVWEFASRINPDSEAYRDIETR